MSQYRSERRADRALALTVLALLVLGAVTATLLVRHLVGPEPPPCPDGTQLTHNHTTNLNVCQEE